MTTVLDDKLVQYRAKQGEMSALIEIKTSSLSQFNENSLVASVRHFPSPYLPSL